MVRWRTFFVRLSFGASSSGTSMRLVSHICRKFFCRGRKLRADLFTPKAKQIPGTYSSSFNERNYQVGM